MTVVMTALVYFTAPNDAVAREIAASLLDRRLAACVNLVGRGTSLYRWNGTLQEDAETYVLVKTSEDRVAATIAAIVAEHPYETPAVLSWSATAAHPAFGDWVREQTTDE